MILLEHDAKEILAGYGVPVPAGILVANADGIDVDQLPPGPWMVKAQVASGGRGKAGGIIRADSAREISAAVRMLVGREIAGHKVGACRVETVVSDGREVYIGFTIDPREAAMSVLLSPSGGVDIEPLVTLDGDLNSLNSICKIKETQDAVASLSATLPEHLYEPVRAAGLTLAEITYALRAMLLEVNPVFVLPTGDWLAGDAKIVLDDNVISEIPAVRKLIIARRPLYESAYVKLTEGFDYVELAPRGEVGLLTTGAGLSMMLIDEMVAHGIEPFNFCDVRAGLLRGDPRRLVDVLRWIGRGSAVRALFVNIFAGVTDLGEFARLLLQALDALPAFRMPIVARLIGNGFENARQTLAASQIPITVETELERALDALDGVLGKSHRADA